MGKSKHPGLVDKALSDIKRVARDKDAAKKQLTAFSKGCDSAGKLATSTAKDFETQYKYLQDVIEKYARKAIEIETLEGQQADAKGDKKKEADLKKQLAKLEKEADALRKEYNDAGAVFSTLSGLMVDEMNRLGTAASNFNPFSP